MPPSGDPRPTPPAPPRIGVRIAGTGSFLPERRLTNADLAGMMDTSDEWIVQRTGIRERRIVEPGTTITPLATESLRKALQNAGLKATDLDLVMLATVSMEMGCPSSACRIAANLGAGHAAAMDLTAACCGFVYGLNLAHGLVRTGAYRTVAVIGAEILSQYMEYTTEGRALSILFGDAAGCAILRATDDMSKGCLAQSMHADGTRWHDLYIPRVVERDVPPGVDPATKKAGIMYMNGREVFKFAVGTFQSLIQETLDKAGLTADQVDQYICHQSNARILEAARERFGIPREKLYVNIDRVGNTSAASVPLCFDELRAAGTVKEGDVVMFVAFGGGLTWASSLWRL
ncbi:MAG: beta-ketoacyl-ACP synthase III [Phycisphaerales bacterium]